MRSYMLASLLCLACFACLATACVSVVGPGPDPGKSEDAPFAILDGPIGGKADETGAILPAEDSARLESALTAAIDATAARIADLEEDIAKLEADNQRKATEVDTLVNLVEGRRREIQSEYDMKRNICLICIFGGCAPVCFVSLAGMMDDDQTLRGLNRQLADARSQQAQIARTLADCAQQRDGLRADLETLRAGQATLAAALAGEAVSVPPELAEVRQVARSARRVDLLGQVLQNSQDQVGVLLRIRDLAQAVSDVLDRAIATLRALASSAETALEASRQATWDLLIMATSPDPAAAAASWLEDRLAARTAAMIRALGWPAGDFVAALIESRGAAGEDPADLASRLLDALMDTSELHTVRLSGDGGEIRDLQTATRTAATDAGGQVLEATLALDIRHTYRGDLLVSVVHDGQEEVVRDRTGGAEDDLAGRFQLTRFAGQPAAGTWELRVTDGAPGDEGQLVSWGLELVVH